MNNTTTMTVLATAIALSFGAAALADSMTKPQHASAKNEIEATYKAAKVSCDALKANAKDICMAEAKGKEKVALADLEVTYKPTTKARYEARVAKADAAYSLAKEKCDDLTGNPKDVCVKEAKAALVRAKADAKVDRVAMDTRQQAANKQADASREANADKRDADYKVAIEKCDALSGPSKDACIGNAKARFGKT